MGGENSHSQHKMGQKKIEYFEWTESLPKKDTFRVRLRVRSHQEILKWEQGMAKCHQK